MKLLIFLSALASAQVELFTGNWRNVSLDALLVGMQGGSIIDHLQQRLDEYGIPQEFLDDLEANVTDAAWAGIVTGVSWVLSIQSTKFLFSGAHEIKTTSKIHLQQLSTRILFSEVLSVKPMSSWLQMP